MAGPEDRREDRDGRLAGEGQKDRSQQVAGSADAAHGLGTAAQEAAAAEGIDTGELLADLTFRVDVARRYHARLADHYELIARLSTSAALIGGTAVVTQLIGGLPGVEIAFGVLVVVASTLSLVFDWTGKASAHRNLYARYGQLAARAVREGYSADLRAEEIDIEVDEGAVRHVLYLIAWNEQCNAGQLGPARYPLTWLQRRFAYFFDLGPAVWEREPN